GGFNRVRAPIGSRHFHHTAPEGESWTRLIAPVRHVFTHFELRLDVFKLETEDAPTGEGRWVPQDRLSNEALPSLFKKVLKSAGF
ncbi:MAG: NUDIX domain-containing protein, partial [Pseudomonadota bacterium]